MADEKRVIPYTGLAGAIQAFGQPVAQAIGTRVTENEAMKRIAAIMQGEHNALAERETELQQQIGSLVETTNMETMQVPQVGSGGRITMKDVELPDEARKALREQARPRIAELLKQYNDVKTKKNYLESNPVTGAILRGDVTRPQDIQATGLIKYPQAKPEKWTTKTTTVGENDIWYKVNEAGDIRIIREGQTLSAQQSRDTLNEIFYDAQEKAHKTLFNERLAQFGLGDNASIKDLVFTGAIMDSENPLFKRVARELEGRKIMIKDPDTQEVREATRDEVFRILQSEYNKLIPKAQELALNKFIPTVWRKRAEDFFVEASKRSRALPIDDATDIEVR